jgi:hypothetical protein
LKSVRHASARKRSIATNFQRFILLVVTDDKEPNDKTSKANEEDTLIGTHIDDLDEAIAAQQTLKDATKSKAPQKTAEDETMEVMMRLSPEQKARAHDFLSQSLKPHDKGDGISDGTSSKSKESLAAAQKKKPMPKLRAMFDEYGDISDEFKERAAEAFDEAVARKTVAQALRQVFESDATFKLMFATDDTIDWVDYYATRVTECEAQLAEIIQENSKLRKLRKETKMKRLREDTLYAVRQEQSSQRRRSLRAEDLEDVDESNRVLVEQDGSTAGLSPMIRKSLDVIARSTRNTDAYKDPMKVTDNLMESWRLTRVEF